MEYKNLVTKQQKQQWGSYSDRRNNFDDDGDIIAFKTLCCKNKDLMDYIKKYLPKGDYKWVSKPDGNYGVDMGVLNEDTGEICLTMDLERWSQWKEDWPSYYRYLHFLGRKDKYLEKDIPFIMVFLNYNQDKVILLDKGTLNRYETREKYFSHKNCNDMVKEIPMKDGYVFGSNITDRELNNFRTVSDRIVYGI